MHATTHRLSPYSRFQLVLMLERHMSVTGIAHHFMVSRTTVYRWKERFEVEGLVGLEDRSSRPRRLRFRMSDAQIAEATALRASRGLGPRRIAPTLGVPASTVARTLRRSRRTSSQRTPAPPPRRYVMAAPGDLVHLDVLHVAGAKGFGHVYQFSVVDDCTRQAWATLSRKRNAAAALQALRAAEDVFGYPIKAVMTDNDATFTLVALPQMWKGAPSAPPTFFERWLAAHGITHRRTAIRRPQTNGKVERFHRTIREECWRPFEAQLGVAIRPPSRNAEGAWRERARQLAQVTTWDEVLTHFLTYYNNDRLHTALNQRTPTDRRNDFYPAPTVLPTY